MFPKCKIQWLLSDSEFEDFNFSSRHTPAAEPSATRVSYPFETGRS